MYLHTLSIALHITTHVTPCWIPTRSEDGGLYLSTSRYVLASCLQRDHLCTEGVIHRAVSTLLSRLPSSRTIQIACHPSSACLSIWMYLRSQPGAKTLVYVVGKSHSGRARNPCPRRRKSHSGSAPTAMSPSSRSHSSAPA
jgi:hypothetical protein